MSTTRAQAIDWYEILEVSPNARNDVIIAAWKRLAAEFHPDVDRDDCAAARMSTINQAKDVLTDPIARAQYDRTRAESFGARSNPEPPEPSRQRSQQASGDDPRAAGPPRQPRFVTCSVCRGSGTSTKPNPRYGPYAPYTNHGRVTVDCLACGGTGKVTTDAHARAARERSAYGAVPTDLGSSNPLIIVASSPFRLLAWLLIFPFRLVGETCAAFGVLALSLLKIAAFVVALIAIVALIAAATGGL